MSYRTNGYQIGTTLSALGNEYSVLDAFDGYPALTVDQHRTLPEAVRKARVQALYAKVGAELDVDVESMILPGSEDRVLNGEACPDAVYYLIEASVNYGAVTGGGLYRAGEVVTLDSEPDIPRPFLGWFLGDVLLYSQKPWIFPATGDLSPSAKYDEVVAIPVSATADDHSQVGVTLSGPWSGSITVAALAGEEVRFFVQVALGYRIDRWENGDGVPVSDELSCIVAASDQDENLNKVFVRTKPSVHTFTLANAGLTGSYTISQDGYVTDPLAKRWLGGSDIVLDEATAMSNNVSFSFNRPLYVRNMSTGQQQLILASQVVPNGSANITV